ncbi:hypothetical protein GYMLUDRAFT_46653 [Collybiopsis luxurians FD-317 M1]|uniref:Uncharacterized protein n=1 Tax=Collybiopsis luxurians FD-317 M1 TaxID=944289 RepID=A0A0D0BPQ6_9AGAR|nr:hypothetical protein GYMLUDRAFT_46653 [Collybiopsis luxurians FD-317 M1]
MQSFVTGPSFFPNSHNFQIYGGSFAAFHNSHIFVQAAPRLDDSERNMQDAPHSDDSCVIRRHQINMNDGKVICTRQGSRFSSATMGSGSLKTPIVVQAFEGPKAKEQFRETLQFLRGLINPHVLEIKGTSPASTSDDSSPYFVFDGACRNDTRRLMASRLKNEVHEILALGSQIVYGVASGLDCISKANPELSLADIGVKNFDVFSNERGHSVVSFTLEHGTSKRKKKDKTWRYAPYRSGSRNHVTTSPKANQTLSDSDLVIFNSLVTKIFNDANHTLHGGNPERSQADLYTSSSIDFSDSSSCQLNSAGFSEQRESQELDPRLRRREIVWMSSGSKTSLAAISRSYQDLLDVHSTFDHIPRRLGSRVSATWHRCPGYSREEVTLFPNAFQNEIAVFTQPSGYERCARCGEMIEYNDLNFERDFGQWFNPSDQALEDLIDCMK